MLSLTMAAFALTPGGAPAAVSAQPEYRCAASEHNRLVTVAQPSIYRQGATIRITPQFDKMPSGYEDIDPRCLSDWRITGPARLSDDRRSIVIAPDAPPGAEIHLSYRWRTEQAELHLPVVARDAVVLTGTRGQTSVEGCGELAPLRELVFAPGNQFSVTFEPFESYKDYWGSYRFDPATGAISMHVEEGNNVPSGLDLEGRAILGSDGHLVLEDMYFGNGNGPPPATPSCRYTF